MKTNLKKTPGAAGRRAVRVIASLLASCSLLALSQLPAEATSLAGHSTTVLRMRENTLGDNVFPLYEYLHLYASDAGSRGATSLELGAWGRVDLWDRSHEEREEGDIPYGFLSYQGNRNNLRVNAGRQFVVEGVAADRLDGFYVRSDLTAGFTGAMYVGSPAYTEPTFRGGEVLYGGRIAHAMPNIYSVGLSALRNEENGDGLREEEGIDLWVRAGGIVDLTGRSTYNSLTSGWQEHAYTASVSAIEMLAVSLSMQQVNYDDYFHHVTTRALSLDNGLLRAGEELWKWGGSVAFNPMKSIGVSGEYQRYQYEDAGSADYFGASAGFTTPNAFAAGLSYHRMAGSSARLSYNQFRAWASQELGAVDVTLDFFDVYYDSSINGIKNTWSLAATAGYDLTPALRVAADVDYLRSTDFDHELRGLVKVSYAFGLGKEGR